MAYFFAFLTPTGPGTAEFSAYFDGGDPTYMNRRNVEVRLFQAGVLIRVEGVLSQQTSGATNSFYGQIGNLSPGTTYEWAAVLQYSDGHSWVYTDFTGSGEVTMPQQVTGVQAWIYDNGWKRSRPWVYRDGSGWELSQPWIHETNWR